MAKRTTPTAAAAAARDKILQALKEHRVISGGSAAAARIMQSQAAQNCLAVLEDTSKPAETRAQFIMFHVNEFGQDLLPTMTRVVERLDKERGLETRVAILQAAAKESEEEKDQVKPLHSELFQRRVEVPGGVALRLLTPAGPQILPIRRGSEKELEGLRRGDFVLVDRQTSEVVGRDDLRHPSGELVTVEEVPDGEDGLAIVKLRDESFTADVADELRENAEFQPGCRVVYDSLRQFLHRLGPDRTDGSELLTPASELSEFTVESLGSPHPVLWKLFRLLKRSVERPDWARKMKARVRWSYLFHGPTGTGKTCTLKALANLLEDWIEELTGERTSRIVFCDASHFYSPYFGEAEQKITAWFKKLSRIARKVLVTRDGRTIRVPLLVVFEEIEGLVRQRGELGASSHLFDRVLSLILQKMDEVRSELDVPLLVVSTSNKKSLVDSAAKRRFGQREARFGMLDARASLAVLEKKIPEDIALRVPAGETPAAVRRNMLRKALYYLFGETDDQVLARVVLREGSRLEVRRRELVSGSTLEAAVSQAIDDSLDRSEERGELLGLDAATLVDALKDQYDNLATSLDRHNVQEFLPELFESLEQPHIVQVQRLRSHHRPVSHYTT